MNVLEELQQKYFRGNGGNTPTVGAPPAITVTGTWAGGAPPMGGDSFDQTAGTGGPFNPTPTRGLGPYGGVPGQIVVPKDIQDNISYDAKGLIRPDVAARLQNEAAAKGVASGMPGSGLQWNSYLHDYLGASDVARKRAYDEYLGLVPVAEQNAVNAAAPDPQHRGELEWSHAKEMFDRYLQQLGWGGNRGGGGSGYRSPAGGTGEMAPPPVASRPTGSATPLPTSPYPHNDFQPDPTKPWDWGAPGGTWYDASNDTYNAPTNGGPTQADVDRLLEEYMNGGGDLGDYGEAA